MRTGHPFIGAWVSDPNGLSMLEPFIRFSETISLYRINRTFLNGASHVAEKTFKASRAKL
jgi:hypothetical protein